MSWLDKLMGRGKRATGEATDSPGLRDEGRHQETAGRASERAESHEDRAQAERERAARERAEQERSNP
ncbi:MAG: CsbD family protein [Actinobacteria bacterium]|nr:CsbD family protein [Actinomycetota bacterium]